VCWTSIAAALNQHVIAPRTGWAAIELKDETQLWKSNDRQQRGLINDPSPLRKRTTRCPGNRWLGCVVLAGFLCVALITSAQTSPAAEANGSQSGVAAAESIESMLTARGLVASNFSAIPATIEPPNGAEVDETTQTAKADGKTISQSRSWTEKLDRNALHIELTTFPDKQSQVAFWVLPDDSPGCSVFGRTMYDNHGRPLQSEFWRNDRQLKITGAADFPPDLYPEALPAIALARAVDFTRQGASGRINQQLSPYGFVDQTITVKDSYQLQVPAGRFTAVKIESQPNASSVLPAWPRFTLGAVSPFLPTTIYYFQADPPHRFLRKEQPGTPFIAGPAGVTELVRYYIAGSGATRRSIE
jgi:hypothetical protein